MPRPQLILPQADASCGKTFFADRRTADGHRIGLEVWNRATGRARAGYRLAVYRCRRCGGYHIGYRPEDRASRRPPDRMRLDLDRDEPATLGGWEGEVPRMSRAACPDPAWG